MRSEVGIQERHPRTVSKNDVRERHPKAASGASFSAKCRVAGGLPQLRVNGSTSFLKNLSTMAVKASFCSETARFRVLFRVISLSRNP